MLISEKYPEMLESVEKKLKEAAWEDAYRRFCISRDPGRI